MRFWSLEETSRTLRYAGVHCVHVCHVEQSNPDCASKWHASHRGAHSAYRTQLELMREKSYQNHKGNASMKEAKKPSFNPYYERQRFMN